MENKNEEKMINLLQEIKERLTANSWPSFRGPGGDPGPEWDPYRPFPFPRPYPYPGPPFHFPRPIDPSPEFFLRKEQIAILKVKEIDILINQYKSGLDILETQRNLLAKEYKIK